VVKEYKYSAIFFTQLTYYSFDGTPSFVPRLHPCMSADSSFTPRYIDAVRSAVADRQKPHTPHPTRTAPRCRRHCNQANYIIL